MVFSEEIEMPDLRRRNVKKNSADYNGECLGEICDRLMPSEEKIDFVKAWCKCPPPIFMPLVLLAQGILFVVNFKVMSTEAFLENPLIFNSSKKEFHSFFSYALLHASIVHFVANCVVQLSFGVILELMLKYYRVCILYMSGVLAGSLASSVFAPLPNLVGSSGGAHALIVGYAVNLVMTWKKMPWNVLQAVIVLILIVLSIFCDIFGCSIGENIVVSWQSHVGGSVAGFLIGFVVVVANKGRLKGEQKVKFWIISVAFGFIYAVCCIAAIIWIFRPVPAAVM